MLSYNKYNFRFPEYRQEFFKSNFSELDLEILSEREINIIKLYFGVRTEPLDHQEIARIENVTKQRIGQIIRKSFHRLIAEKCRN